MPLITVEVLIAGVSALVMAVVYGLYHTWWASWFTRWVASLVCGLGLILVYVMYNVIAVLVHWPIASGTIVAELVYGILAVVMSFGAVVFIVYTRRDLAEKREEALHG
jgi:hypothetical protein